MIDAFNDYRRETGKKLHIAFADDHFYAAIDEPYNLLEPNLWTSNARFELMVEFYRDLRLLTRLVEEFELFH
jgi:hypothetical protein